MPSSLGDKIRKHRLEKGYSLDKLAELTDSRAKATFGSSKTGITA